MKTSLERSRSRDGTARRRLLAFFFLLALASWSGCAVHYADRRTGAEHLWGFGQLQLETHDAGTNFVLVTTGSRVPGLCFDFGPDHFGLSVGYAIRQETLVVGTNGWSSIREPQARPAWLLSSNSNGVWGLGHLQLNSVPSRVRRDAIITGKAVAGIRANAGADGTSLNVGLDARQRLAVTGQNLELKIDHDAPRWPGFDLFAARVETLAFVPTNQHQEKP